MIFMYPIERTILPDPRMCIIAWDDLVYNARRTVVAPNIDVMVFPY
jgi:hypothetical protein